MKTTTLQLPRRQHYRYQQDNSTAKTIVQPRQQHSYQAQPTRHQIEDEKVRFIQLLTVPLLGRAIALALPGCPSSSGSVNDAGGGLTRPSDERFFPLAFVFPILGSFRVTASSRTLSPCVGSIVGTVFRAFG